MPLKKRCLLRRRIVSIRLFLIIIIAALVLLSASTVFAQSFLITPLEFDFGDIHVGTSASSQEVTITNVTGVSQSVTLAGGAAGVFGGATTCSGTLAPGASCTVEYAFSPTDVGSADRTTTLSVNGDPVSFSFMGNGIKPLLISPTSFDFGNVAPGSTSSTQKVTITNVSSETQPVTLTGGAAGVFGGATTCSGTLAPGASCTVEYAFSPTDVGSADRTTTLTVNEEPVTFSFSGTGGTTGANPLVISPRSFNYGDIATGETTPSQKVTITNVSSVSQSVTLAGGAAGVFGGATTCSGTLAPGASCTVEYAFSPTDVGSADRTTTLTVNGEPITISFTGSGIEPFLITPLTFDFGEIELGSTSPYQSVDILNVSDVMQTLTLAGGAAGVFGGASLCSSSLLPDEMCSILYAFTPTDAGPVTRTTTLDVSGRLVEFTFYGIGNGPETIVPEPSSLLLLGSGLALIGYRWRRREDDHPPG